MHLGILSFAVISAMVLGGVSTAIGGSLSQRGFGYGDVVPRTTLAVPVTLTNNSVGVDTSGSAVQVSQGAFQVGNVGGAVTLPVVVSRDNGLETFSDDGTGVTVTKEGDKTIVHIPVKDDNDNTQLVIKVTTSGIIGTGDSAEGIIERLELEVPERQVDLSLDDPDVGTASVQLVANLTSIPQGASIEVVLVKDPNRATTRQITNALADLGATIGRVAFSVDFRQENLDAAVGPATLTFKVGRSWVDLVGLDSIRIIRVADDGTIQVLVVKSINLNVDPVVITVESPDGLSSFTLVGIEEAAVVPIIGDDDSGTSILWYVIPAVIAVMLLLGGGFFLMQRTES